MSRNEPIDLTSDSSEVGGPASRQPPKPLNQPGRIVPPPFLSGVINPPVTGRSFPRPGPSEYSQMPLHTSSTGPICTPRQGPKDVVPLATSAARTNSKNTSRYAQDGTSSIQIPLRSSQKRVAHQTPRRRDWTAPQIEEALRGLANDIGIQSARRTNRLLLTSWREATPKNTHTSRKNWFAEVQPIPVEPGRDTLKLKTKQIGPGRTGKQEKREHYKITSIKTDKEAVPNYDFHYVEISKNILSPNTMLGFVPHLRDLADHEESKYRLWLKELESMDKISGFQTSSRQDKVRKTCQKERATTLLLHLPSWLKKLSIDGCTKEKLIQHMASQTDAVTPQQKSSILQSYGEGSDSHVSKTVSLFTEAFDKVFDDDDAWEEGAVTLRDVLLLDESVDSVADSKKNLKDTPSQSLLPGKSTIDGCGYGLFTAEDIRQDDFVIEYVGELISQDEGVRREARRGDIFDEQQQSSYLFTLLEQEGTWVDAAIYGNLSRYINHQDDGNIMPQILYVGGEYRIKFTAQRDIKTGEELFFNYGKEFPNLTKQLLDSQKAENEAHEQDLREGGEDGADEPRDARRQKRGRRPKKSFAVLSSDIVDEADHDGEDEADHASEEELPTPRRGSGPRSRHRVAESPVVDFETPSRRRRLFSRAQALQSSSFAPTTEQYFQPIDNDEHTETTVSPQQSSQTGQKKRGRPKRLPQDEAVTTNKRARSGSHKVTRSRVDRNKNYEEESDTSSTDLISRSRVRKRPARYDD
ncbi:hypothetical protein E8E14_011539 [Neopestalotiopsis sp. 37M]|nr:hypothetical protein E8E14_011539 [Neopestalotiopsis sp. 37M]